MGHRIFLRDAADLKQSLGAAEVDDVPVVGDVITLSGGACQKELRVKSRHFFVSNLDDPPPSPKPGDAPLLERVDLLVEPTGRAPKATDKDRFDQCVAMMKAYYDAIESRLAQNIAAYVLSWVGLWPPGMRAVFSRANIGPL